MCDYINQSNYWTKNRYFSGDRRTLYTGRDKFGQIIARTLGKIMEGEHKTITEMTLEEKIIVGKIIEIEVDAETIRDMY